MERTLDVHLEIDPMELLLCSDPAREIAALAHVEAERIAAENGGKLRHSEPVDVYAREAIRPVDGLKVLLVATRWVVD